MKLICVVLAHLVVKTLGQGPPYFEPPGPDLSGLREPMDPGMPHPMGPAMAGVGDTLFPVAPPFMPDPVAYPHPPIGMPLPGPGMSPMDTVQQGMEAMTNAVGSEMTAMNDPQAMPPAAGAFAQGMAPTTDGMSAVPNPFAAFGPDVYGQGVQDVTGAMGQGEISPMDAVGQMMTGMTAQDYQAPVADPSDPAAAAAAAAGGSYDLPAMPDPSAGQRPDTGSEKLRFINDSPAKAMAVAGVKNTSSPKGPLGNDFLNPIICKRTKYCYIDQRPGTLQMVDIATPIHDVASTLIKILSHNNSRANVIICPVCISATMAVVHHLADKNTKKQMNEALRLPDSTYTNLRPFNKNETDTKSLLAYRMFLQKNYPSSPALPRIVTDINGSLEVLDYLHDGQTAISSINTWASKSTENQIPELFNEPLSPAPQILLASVAYFKSSWKTPFSKDETKERDFHMQDGTTKKATMMTHRNKRFGYFNDFNTQCQYLELPFKSLPGKKPSLSLLLALPRKFGPPVDLEMSSNMLCYILSNMNNTTELLEVIMPKFRIEHQVQLKEPLKRMGVTDLFDKGKASLPAVSTAHRFFVDSVVHSAVLEIDEGKAANATASSLSQVRNLFPGPSFKADRPFYLYVIDKEKQLILLSGKLSDPLM